MVQRTELAVELAQAFIKAFQVLEDSVVLVRKQCSEDELSRYVHSVGPILYDITEKLMDPLYQQHPQLKPADWPRDVSS